MMQRELLVYLDVKGGPVRVGRLWARERAGRETSSFVYDATWLKRKGAFALSPTLMLTSGQFQAQGLPTVFADTAPDSWGRKTALGAARLFGIKPERARALAAQIGAITAGWREVGRRLGLSGAQLERARSTPSGSSSGAA